MDLVPSRSCWRQPAGPGPRDGRDRLRMDGHRGILAALHRMKNIPLLSGQTVLYPYNKAPTVPSNSLDMKNNVLWPAHRHFLGQKIAVRPLNE